MDGRKKDHPMRLMGAGLCRMKGSVMDQLLGMREGICQFNAGAGLRTAFLYSGGWLLHWHEGPAEAVEEVCRRTAADPRHSHLRIIHRSVGPHGLVDPVHIATLQTGDETNDMARHLRQIEREHAIGSLVDPVAIWNWLSAPCPAQPEPAATSARRNMAVVASDYNESVDLIKAVAERYGARINYQRFADSNVRSGDVGAAYVDVNDPEGIIRVQALSRRALTNSMVRITLRNTHGLVLLLGTRLQSITALAQGIASMLAACKARPPIRLIGPSDAICARAAELIAALPGGSVPDIHPGLSGRARINAVLSAI
jgi:hypothetical protein